MPVLGRLSNGALSLLPGALLVFISFNGGGFFVGTTALATVILAGVLVLWLLFAPDPFGTLSWRLALAAGAFGLFALWALISSGWSDSPARALVSYDRALLYATALLLFGFVGGGPARERAMIRGLVLAGTSVCLAGLITRILPKVWTVPAGFGGNRLSYPLTYWNGLGLLAAITIVFAAYLASASREKPVVRVLASGAIPILAATLLFTYSRGGLAATAIGVLAYIVIARPRGALTAAVAVVPATAVAVTVAYDADLLAHADRSSSAAISQGHHVALVVALAALAAAGLRALLLRFDGPIARFRVSPPTRQAIVAGGAAAAVVAAVLALTAFGLASTVHAEYHRFVDEGTIPVQQDPRARITSPGNNGRLEIWRIALDAFDAQPLHGTGGNTFRLVWNMHRPQPQVVNNAHSLYLEVLAELGLPGLALLLVGLVTILVVVAARVWKREDRTVYGAILAVMLAWVLHAGVDWDWQIPAVTLWLFILGGVALAAPPRPGGAKAESRIARWPWLRVVVALGVAIVAVTPTLMALSQLHLNRAVAAVHKGDCAKAIDEGLSSISSIGSRPEPWEIVGYCDAHLGANGLAVRALRNAVDRDPKDWEFRYGLALVSAQAGLDPRPAALKAVALSPREPLAKQAVAMFASGSRRSWARRARQAPLDIP